MGWTGRTLARSFLDHRDGAKRVGSPDVHVLFCLECRHQGRLPGKLPSPQPAQILPHERDQIRPLAVPIRSLRVDSRGLCITARADRHLVWPHDHQGGPYRPAPPVGSSTFRPDISIKTSSQLPLASHLPSQGHLCPPLWSQDLGGRPPLPRLTQLFSLSRGL